MVNNIPRTWANRCYYRRQTWHWRSRRRRTCTANQRINAWGHLSVESNIWAWTKYTWTSLWITWDREVKTLTHPGTMWRDGWRGMGRGKEADKGLRKISSATRPDWDRISEYEIYTWSDSSMGYDLRVFRCTPHLVELKHLRTLKDFRILQRLT